MTISRKEAKKIIESHISSILEQYVKIEKIISSDEASHSLPNIYNLKEPIDDCWIAYLKFPIRYSVGFQSSTVIIISKKTGEVIYSGTAYDEA